MVHYSMPTAAAGGSWAWNQLCKLGLASLCLFDSFKLLACVQPPCLANCLEVLGCVQSAWLVFSTVLGCLLSAQLADCSGVLGCVHLRSWSSSRVLGCVHSAQLANCSGVLGSHAVCAAGQLLWDDGLRAGIRLLVALTKVDELDPELSIALHQVFNSLTFQSVVVHLSEEFGLPPNHFFPLKNLCCEYSLADNPDVAPLVLQLLQHVMLCSAAYVEESSGFVEHVEGEDAMSLRSNSVIAVMS